MQARGEGDVEGGKFEKGNRGIHLFHILPKNGELRNILEGSEKINQYYKTIKIKKEKLEALKDNINIRVKG